MLYILILGCLQFSASASLIHGYGNTIAEYGGEAHYSCSVGNPTAGVLQVTWQRLFKDGPIENLATFSKRFGQQVNAPYLGKVTLTEASLNSTSISLSNVSWQDESCYICSFNAYPDGSKQQQTCLSVQGISSVDTAYVPRAARGGDGMEVEFSCSATGKPVPTIDWDVSPGATRLYQSKTTTEPNGDHTFTSSDNITLQVPAGWSGHVDCLLNRGARGQRRETIPFSVGPQHPKKEDEKRRPHLLLSVIIPTLCIITSIAAAVIVVVTKRKRLMQIINHHSKRKEPDTDVDFGISCI
ncbi:OX-2 membrane glycoprotein [Pleuronectes platessa]|uniref:OX-2 membrane glycoprotein n=1 Tax=Pleuronectes platessa TaxID=8262 RepID=UPI00232A6875|nr:OX-2 membrane glycoprotein [Pleuronectes platessa]